MTTDVFITASAVFLPRPPAAPTAGPLAAVVAEAAGREEPPLDKVHLVVGRKGLLYKEAATRTALAAVHRALGLPEGTRVPAPLPGGDRTAVVVSSNLGNVETVGDIVRHVREGRLGDVSALAGPNASSNIIASTIALRFGFGAANLMVCSGATGGLDALRAGARLLRAGRADRVVVAGAEPDDPVAARLAAQGPDTEPLTAAAACVVLEGTGPGVRVGAFQRYTGRVAEEHARDRGLVAGRGFVRDTPERGLGLTGTYGASGVLYAALAARALRDPDGPADALVACGDDEDGHLTLVLERVRETAAAGGAR